MGNKLFVIGGYDKSSFSCEVFDSYSRKFTLISSVNINILYDYSFQDFCVGYKILVFASKKISPRNKYIYL